MCVCERVCKWLCVYQKIPNSLFRKFFSLLSLLFFFAVFFERKIYVAVYKSLVSVFSFCIGIVCFFVVLKSAVNIRVGYYSIHLTLCVNQLCACVQEREKSWYTNNGFSLLKNRNEIACGSDGCIGVCVLMWSKELWQQQHHQSTKQHMLTSRSIVVCLCE